MSPEIPQSLLSTPSGQAIVSGMMILLGWAMSEIFNNTKKQMKELKVSFTTMVTQQTAEHAAFNTEMHKQALAMERMNGQISLALASKEDIDKMRERVSSVDSQLKAVWRVIDQKRTSDS